MLGVMAMWLVDFFGSKSSVGGPMTGLLVAFLIMLAVGIFESRGRGPLGWIVNIILAVIGGLVAISLMSTAMDTMLSLVHFQGKLVVSNPTYIASAAMAANRQPVDGSNRSLKHSRQHHNDIDFPL